MSDTRTTYVIQMYSDLRHRWEDLSGQLTRGYDTLVQAREAFASGWPVERRYMLGTDQFQIVQRIVTEQAFEI